MKKVQVKALRKFARAMKWPNLAKVDEVLKERDVDDVALEDRSSDAMSYFTGMILPGCTMPCKCGPSSPVLSISEVSSNCLDVTISNPLLRAHYKLSDRL